MPRIISIDYGAKRTGLAVTDPLQIIATGLTTVESKQLIPFLKGYFAKEEVELIIIGEPKNWDDTDTHATALVERIIKQLEKNFPKIPIKKVDERYTSKMAKALRVSQVLHFFSAACVLYAGWLGNFGWLYWIGAAIFIGMLVYQHSIVKPNDLKRVNIAFMTANGIASVVFAIFVIADLFIN